MHTLTEKDLGPTSKEIKDPKKNIKKGFVWLGVSSIISQALDAISMLVILIFVSKEDLGLATIAIGFTTLTEAFCATGIAPAMIQDDQLSVQETHSMYWLSLFFGIGFFCIILIPFLFPVSYFYQSSALIPLLLAGCIRNVFCSLRQVPTTLLRRRLEYSVISRNDIITNLTSGCSKIVLACLGFGAWSLVFANLLREFMTFLLYSISAHYLPAMHFKFAECKRFIKFIIKNTGATLLDALNKNLHYFIVGKIFGNSVLGLYRVAYELATTPPVALLNVVNNSSFPVFSRFKSSRKKLSSLFSWNISSLAFLTIIPTVFIAFCSEDIFSLINHGEWMEAVYFMPIILAFAFIKSIAQTFPELYRACGFPEYVFKITALETILCLVFFISSMACCKYFDVSYITSIQVLFGVWIAVYFVLFYVLKNYAMKFIDISIFSIFKSLSGSILFFLVSAGISIIPWIFRNSLPLQPWLHFGIETVILLICLGVYFKWIRKSSKDIVDLDSDPGPENNKQ